MGEYEQRKRKVEEEIKQVKAKYFYAFDHKDWEMWRNEVWAPDGRLEVPEFRPEPFTPFEEVLRYASESAADQTSVHHGHMPIIEITSDTTAKGIWWAIRCCNAAAAPWRAACGIATSWPGWGATNSPGRYRPYARNW